MRNPYISIFSTRNLPAKNRELASLWELFMAKHREETVSDKLRTSILDSWRRCQETGVNPGQLQTKPAFTNSELTDIQNTSELYKVARPIMDDLFFKISGTGYLATLADEKGRIIYLKGDLPITKEAEKMNFTVGMDWSEKTAGTNAIGTSITTKTPIQIFSAEHFCQGCHPWTCSSAPVTHPFTGKIIGAVDFTSLWDNAQPHTLGLALSLAQAIEKELSHTYLKINNYLAESFYYAVKKWKNNGIIVVNRASFIVKFSEMLQEKFNLSTGINLSAYDVFQSLADEMNKISSTKDQAALTSDLFVGDFYVQAIEQLTFMGTVAGYLIILNDRAGTKASPCSKNPQNNPWKDIIGYSTSFLRVLSKCHKAALSDAPILLLGESGTGKEKIARSIHNSSHRSDMPFLAINCGAFQKELIGSELFGYEKGTFTGGAKGGKKGKFEEANGGTIFLDEVGEMPLELQVHLLRVLQEKEITRLGSSRPISVNVRILAATNKNLFEMCKKGLFREDLFFRLNVVTVNLPPLRERKEDIVPLAEYFLNQFAEKYAKPPLSLSDETRDYLLAYNWPGNVRELQNALEYAAIFCETTMIEQNDLPTYLLEPVYSHSQSYQQNISPLIETEEKKILISLLEETNWNLSAVARKMKIARTTLYRKLKKYQLQQ